MYQSNVIYRDFFSTLLFSECSENGSANLQVALKQFAKSVVMKFLTDEM